MRRLILQDFALRVPRTSRAASCRRTPDHHATGLECADTSALWIPAGRGRQDPPVCGGSPSTILPCASRAHPERRHAAALQTIMPPVWSAQTRLRFRFPRSGRRDLPGCGGSYSKILPCASRAHPERRHAAALQTIMPPHSKPRCRRTHTVTLRLRASARPEPRSPNHAPRLRSRLRITSTNSQRSTLNSQLSTIDYQPSTS